MSPLLRRRPLLCLAALAAAVAGPAWAQQPSPYPERPISLVVPFLPGGSTDIAARILAERMAPRLGAHARVVVENRAGAGGSVGAEWVRHRAADGYTLLLASSSALGTNPAALPAQTPYDPVEDFTPIAQVGGGPLVLVVPAASPFRSAEALFAAIRAEPGRYTWATSGAGGIGHLTGELIKIVAGGRPSGRGGGPQAGGESRPPARPLVAEHVPYRGGSAVMEALAKGEVDYSLEVLASTAPHLRDGLSRGLAVTSLRRHPLFPEIPSLDEAGLKGFDITTWNVLVGPRGLPPEITAALARAVRETLAEPEVARRMAAAGVDPAPAAAATPEATRAFLVAEGEKFRGIVRQAGLRLGR